MKKKNTSTRLLNIAIYLLFLFLFQEMFFRFFFPIPEISNFDRVNYMKLYFDGKGSEHSRNQNWTWYSLPDTPATFIHKMNMYGFRDEEWNIKKSDKKQRAMAKGARARSNNKTLLLFI